MTYREVMADDRIGRIPDDGALPLDGQALVKAWRNAEGTLPADVQLCGVVYHGPDSVPGSEWIAFACDSDGNSVGPEGIGIDPVSALRSLVEVMKSRGS
jgi:hypothetical protein